MATVEPSNLSALCFRCDYDLRGIADDQTCPECGLLAARSRRASDELYESRPRWLRSIARGTYLIFLAVFLSVLWSFSGDLLIDQLTYRWRWSRSMRLMSMHQLMQWYNTQALILYFSWWLVVFALGGMFVAGAFLLTRPEGYAPADEADRLRRRWIRILAMGTFAATFVTCLEWRGGGPSPMLIEALLLGNIPLGFGGVALMLVLAGLVVMVFYQLRSMARRARSAHLAEHCAIVGIAAGVSFLYAPTAMLFLQFSDKFLGENSLNRSAWPMLLVISLGVLGMLFLLWSCYLLLRFAISFYRASREIRILWHRDDRAESDGQEMMNDK